MATHCSRHPDRPAAVSCMKMNVGYCEECLDACDACTDPVAYCKFRPQCVIWELCRRSPKRYEREAAMRGEAE